MTERHLTTLQEAAGQLLDTLTRGGPITLEITAQDEAADGLLRLITAVHQAAHERQIGIQMIQSDARSIRLRLADP